MNLKQYDLEPLIRLAKEHDCEVEQSFQLSKNAAVKVTIIVTPL